MEPFNTYKHLIYAIVFCKSSYHVIVTNAKWYNFLRSFIVNKQQQANGNVRNKDSVVQ